MTKQLKIYRGYIGRLIDCNLINKEKVSKDIQKLFNHYIPWLSLDIGNCVLILTIIYKDPYIKLNKYIIKKSPF